MASKLVIITVLVFDLIAFGLAIAAERRKSTARIENDPNLDYNYCVYDSDISTGYGVGAFLFLLASQALLMIVSRCFCCGRALSPGGSRACAVILFIICWLTFLVAELCLFAGSVTNAYHTKYRTYYEDKAPSCQTLRKGVFASAAAFIFLTAVLSEFYYICFSKAKETYQAYGGEAGVSLGAYK